MSSLKKSGFRFDLGEVMSYDIRLHGEKFILAEFSLASAVAAGLGIVYVFYPGITPLYRLQAIFWLGIAVNFLTILSISAVLTRRGLTKEIGIRLDDEERAMLQRYMLLIFIFQIVPYATLISEVKQTRGGRVT